MKLLGNAGLSCDVRLTMIICYAWLHDPGWKRIGFVKSRYKFIENKSIEIGDISDR